MKSTESVVDTAEIGRFGRLAGHWWDPNGPLRTLHAINPLRLNYVCERIGDPKNQRAIDVGCGAGLFAEALAAKGAQMTGIDMATDSITIAREHAELSALEIHYLESHAEAECQSQAGTFDVVTCFEVLEHVPDPQSTIAACIQLAKPGGQVFFSTLNRNAKSFALAIVAAEYLLELLPRGTHDYERFIKPSELARMIRAAGGTVEDLTGLHLNPLTDVYSLGGNVDVNYFCHAVRT